jgi:hypothetical protein
MGTTTTGRDCRSDRERWQKVSAQRCDAEILWRRHVTIRCLADCAPILDSDNAMRCSS